MPAEKDANLQTCQNSGTVVVNFVPSMLCLSKDFYHLSLHHISFHVSIILYFYNKMKFYDIIAPSSALQTDRFP